MLPRRVPRVRGDELFFSARRGSPGRIPGRGGGRDHKSIQDVGAATPTFVPSDVVKWFGVSAQTAREWLGKWRDDGFVQPAKGGVQRVRAYVLAPEWAGVLGNALDSTTDKDG